MRKWRKGRMGPIVLLLCALTALLTGGARAEEPAAAFEPAAKAAALIERSTGRVLYAYHADLALPMASTTKVMTALMALEKGNLDDVVTVGKNAFGVPGTSIYLSEGEKITLRDLLYGLMLASGNDAAVAIAEHIGGTVDEFCKMMTARARELGCTQTNFVNPNGLPVAGHQTTALELSLIAREAMTHPEFREIVSTTRAAIPWEGRTYDRILNNKNKLLSEYPGATGIKTGYTKAAGRCLVFGAKRDGLEVIGVVLNCPDWFAQAERVMDYGFEHFESFTALSAGEAVRMLPVENGTADMACVCAKGDLTAPVPRGETPTIEIELQDALAAGMEAGAVVGNVSLTLDGDTLASTELVVNEPVAKRDYSYEVGRVLQHWVSFLPVAD